MRTIYWVIGGSIVAGLGYYFIATRGGTPVTESTRHLICNSNGNCYEPIASNIKVALDDIAPSKGTVWLPDKNFIVNSITGDSGYPCGIMVPDEVTLNMGGAWIQPAGNFNAIELGRGTELRDGIINVEPITGYDNACVFIDGAKMHGQETGSPTRNILVDNMFFTGAGTHGIWEPGYTLPYKGKGIHFYCRPGQKGVIAFVRANNCATIRMQYPMHIQNLGTGGNDPSYINGNYFGNWTCVEDQRFVAIDRTSGVGVDGNHFDNFNLQTTWTNATPPGPTELALIMSGSVNIFDNIYVWDWKNSREHGKIAVTFRPDTWGNDVTIGGLHFPSDFIDGGAENKVRIQGPA